MQLRVLLHDPCGHAALVLDHSGFQGIEQLAAELVGQLNEESFVYEVALDTVG